MNNLSTIVIVTCCLLGGCASQLTEAEQYERENRIAEVRDLVLTKIADCENAGKQIVYTGPNIQVDDVRPFDPAGRQPW